MKYFLHDTNAKDDEKITELFMSFGYEGIGLFYCILEKIAKQEKPIKTIVLKRQLNIGKKLDKCWFFIESLGLIQSSNNKTFSTFLEKNYNKNRMAYKNPSKWKLIVFEVFKRDCFICQYCGSKENLECDHIIPFSKGGDESFENLTTACRKCNRQKKDKPVSEFINWLTIKNN